MSLSQNYFKNLAQQAEKVVKRGLDRHVKIAVTGLSGSGKTAFVTALVRHLTAQANKDNLPFFDVVQSGRFIACKQVQQQALAVPSFDYTSALKCLSAEAPAWPPSTSRINTLTLALRYQAASGLRAQFAPESTLTIELYDYPGEWLLDLPLLNQDYASWSHAMLEKAAQKPRAEYSQAFCQALAQFDASAVVDQAQLKHLSELHSEYLQALKAHTHVAQLQPGRQLLPGDMAGAPLLAFFPCLKPENISEESSYHQLERRFEAYKAQVVKPFFRDYFCQFDRQVVLLDMFSALNQGPEQLIELQEVMQQILTLFDYGKNAFWSRIWRPKIDKVLFAANKCDFVSSTMHSRLVKLLDELLKESTNVLRFDGVSIDTMAMSSVRSTLDRSVQEGGQTLNCIYGRPLQESQWVTYLPNTPPDHLIPKSQWPEGGFQYLAFQPLPISQQQLTHIRLDHALQFLLGDKLK
ncbi:YcjX family protein [Pseudoalteromonas fenneropenaei]|uniref:YcjX family protein n=1 Tax=Pseudoalteromonas fenneropenaei TaxID=1737459 RepID=A0ABV7CIT1_9GAMM